MAVLQQVLNILYLNTCINKEHIQEPPSG